MSQASRAAGAPAERAEGGLTAGWARVPGRGRMRGQTSWRSSSTSGARGAGSKHGRRPPAGRSVWARCKRLKRGPDAAAAGLSFLRTTVTVIRREEIGIPGHAARALPCKRGRPCSRGSVERPMSRWLYAFAHLTATEDKNLSVHRRLLFGTEWGRPSFAWFGAGGFVLLARASGRAPVGGDEALWHQAHKDALTALGTFGKESRQCVLRGGSRTTESGFIYNF